MKIKFKNMEIELTVDELEEMAVRGMLNPEILELIKDQSQAVNTSIGTINTSVAYPVYGCESIDNSSFSNTSKNNTGKHNNGPKVKGKHPQKGKKNKK